MVFIDVSCFSFIWVSVPGFGAVSLDGFAGVPLVWVMIFIVSHGFPRCYMRFLCLGICAWLWYGVSFEFGVDIICVGIDMFSTVWFRMVPIGDTCVSAGWTSAPGFSLCPLLLPMHAIRFDMEVILLAEALILQFRMNSHRICMCFHR